MRTLRTVGKLSGPAAAGAGRTHGGRRCLQQDHPAPGAGICGAPHLSLSRDCLAPCLPSTSRQRRCTSPWTRTPVAAAARCPAQRPGAAHTAPATVKDWRLGRFRNVGERKRRQAFSRGLTLGAAQMATSDDDADEEEEEDEEEGAEPGREDGSPSSAQSARARALSSPGGHTQSRAGSRVLAGAGGCCARAARVAAVPARVCPAQAHARPGCRELGAESCGAQGDARARNPDRYRREHEYDYEDEFIDDSEMLEYLGGDRRRTKHSGFFVNKARRLVGRAARPAARALRQARPCIVREPCAPGSPAREAVGRLDGAPRARSAGDAVAFASTAPGRLPVHAHATAHLQSMRWYCL